MPTSPAGTRVGGQIYQSKFKIEEDDGEVRHLATVLVAHEAEDTDVVSKLNHFSSWYRLKRAVAWIMCQ